MYSQYITKIGRGKKIPCVKRYHVAGLQAIKVAVNDLQTSAILHQVDRLTYTTTRKKYKKELRNLTLSFSLIKRQNTSSYSFYLKKTLQKEKVLTTYSVKQNCQQPPFSKFY